ncbi:MAG: right-handed parallel beta-helix repeat-containing protein [Planctomycetes bacterium]|nr:right-handed parallel beta-helix repeat-containing protein [Planctomycetota bacterium]MCH8118278.1 right-handed parallel beta-helix repeat-containing protein [Planctomycetota bacterium]
MKEVITSRILRTILLMLIVVVLCPFAHGKIIYVDVDATGANDGSSWADTYWCLQSALADAQSGDEIWVAKGIYRPDRQFVRGRSPRIVASGDRTATFQLKNGVTIKGGYAGFGEPDPDVRDIDLYKTILSGDLNGDDGLNFANNAENSYHVVTGSGTDATAVLDGLTITAGNANGSWQDQTGRGGGLYNSGGSPTITRCVFSRDSAQWGGGMYTEYGDPTLTNCVFSLNSALYGGGIYFYFSPAAITNNTITGNLATGYGGGGIYCGNSSPTVVNTILWNNSPDEIYLKQSSIAVTYSDVQGSWSGVGNINADPMFVDADGADDVIGTEDDNLRLLPGSPCIDAGNNEAVPSSVILDLDGNPRIMNGIVDMGAYERIPTPNVYYVNAGNGDDNDDGLTPQAAFATIQKGIDAAVNGEVVLVYPGLYQEEINFLGKKLTVQGVAAGPAGVPVLQNPGDFAVSFYYGEGPESVLKNFIIRNNFMGIFIAGSSPTISNVTVVDNKYAIEAYAGAEPDISNSIFWNNSDGDLFQCQARYSCIERGDEGEGNIYANPLFVDPDTGDYHLRSERGRYWPEHDVWVLDKVTSPCVDGGDPNADTLNEPMPHGSRINIGAYGGTKEASLSPSEQPCPLSDKAFNPYPADGAIDVEEPVELVILTWTAGLNAASHDVYFGIDGDAVANADTSDTTGTYRGRQAITSYMPPEGFGGRTITYYWRIDEVDSEGNKTTGDVWTFTTIPPPPPKGRACFLGDTSVWVNGALVQISNVVSGQMVGGPHCDLATDCLEQIEKVEEHEGTFECRDIVLESGNRISVVDAHCFMLDSGQWIAAQDLRSGLRLKTLSGTVGIKSVATRAVPFVGKVYNLKVTGVDRYLVSEDGVIVRDY